MLRLYKNILLFVLPMGLGLIFIPIDKRIKFIGLKDECFNHGILLYDRIYHNPEPVDIAFLGSSRTINGINDGLIESKLNNKKRVFNFAFCNFGHNLYYALLKDIIARKKIEKLVIEIREDEEQGSHKIFPFLADTKDVLMPEMVFNTRFLKDIQNHTLYKLELCQDIVFDDVEKVDYKMENYGFASSPDTARTTLLDSAKARIAKDERLLEGIEKDIKLHYPRVYMEDIMEICKANKIEVVFLYLPKYGYEGLPEDYEKYLSYGKVLMFPKEILQKKENWFDEIHFNRAGAKEVADWVSKYL